MRKILIWICLDCSHEKKNFLVNDPLYCDNCWSNNIMKKDDLPFSPTELPEEDQDETK